MRYYNHEGVLTEGLQRDPYIDDGQLSAPGHLVFSVVWSRAHEHGRPYQYQCLRATQSDGDRENMSRLISADGHLDGSIIVDYDGRYYVYECTSVLAPRFYNPRTNANIPHEGADLQKATRYLGNVRDDAGRPFLCIHLSFSKMDHGQKRLFELDLVCKEGDDILTMNEKLRLGFPMTQAIEVPRRLQGETLETLFKLLSSRTSATTEVLEQIKKVTEGHSKEMATAKTTLQKALVAVRRRTDQRGGRGVQKRKPLKQVGTNGKKTKPSGAARRKRKQLALGKENVKQESMA